MMMFNLLLLTLHTFFARTFYGFWLKYDRVKIDFFYKRGGVFRLSINLGRSRDQWIHGHHFLEEWGILDFAIVVLFTHAIFEYCLNLFSFQAFT